MKLTMPWQPMPAPTSEPSGTRVPVLCGQPEQKNGVRTASGAERELQALDLAGRGQPVGREGHGASTRRNGSTRRFGGERAVERDQGLTVGVALAEHQRLVGAAVERVPHQRLDVGLPCPRPRARVVVPAASRRTAARSKRVEGAELQHPDARRRADRRRRGRAWPAPPGPARRRDRRRRCRATVRRSSTTMRLSPFSCDVGERHLHARAEHLGSRRAGRHDVRGEGRRPGLPVDLERRARPAGCARDRRRPCPNRRPPR